MINRLVTSWEFDRGVEVFSPLSGWGDIVHQSSTGSQRFRRARAFLPFLRRSKISLLFLDFLHSAVEQTPSWIFDGERSSPLLRDPRSRMHPIERFLTWIWWGMCRMSQSPHLKYLPKKFQISYLTSFLSGNTVHFKNLQAMTTSGAHLKTKIFKYYKDTIINNVDLARIRRFRKWVLGAETPTTVDRPGYRYGLVMNCSSCSFLRSISMLRKG